MKNYIASYLSGLFHKTPRPPEKDCANIRKMCKRAGPALQWTPVSLEFSLIDAHRLVSFGAAKIVKHSQYELSEIYEAIPAHPEVHRWLKFYRRIP